MPRVNPNIDPKHPGSNLVGAGFPFILGAFLFNFLPLLTRSKKNSPEKEIKLNQILCLLDFTWCLFCSCWMSSTRVVTKGEFEV